MWNITHKGKEKAPLEDRPLEVHPEYQYCFGAYIQKAGGHVVLPLTMKNLSAGVCQLFR